LIVNNQYFDRKDEAGERFLVFGTPYSFRVFAD